MYHYLYQSYNINSRNELKIGCLQFSSQNNFLLFRCLVTRPFGVTLDEKFRYYIITCFHISYMKYTSHVGTY